MANISKEAREDREQKESDEILKRSDNTYISMESFKNYELSYSTAFEMAIRNPKLLKRLSRIIDFYYNHQDKIDFIPKDKNIFDTDFNYRLHRRAQKIFCYWFEYMQYIYWVKPQDLFYARKRKNTIYMLKSYLGFTKISDKNRATNHSHSINVEGINFETSIDYKNKDFFENNEKPSNRDILNAIKEYNLDPCLFERHNSIRVDFSRPKLVVPAVFSKNFSMELNMTLPKQELMNYVEYVKDNYDKSKDDIKMITELLGLDKKDRWYYDADSEGIQKKDRRKTASERLADLFFIYDCYSNNLSMDYTVDHLNRYWNEERNAFPEQFQIKTYKRYLKLAKDFIQNRKYQSLLIGK